MEQFHIDMSGKLDRRNQDIGIACCSADKKVHCGVYVPRSIKKLVEEKLYSNRDVKCIYNRSKFYAVLVCILVNSQESIEDLIICNDESVPHVIAHLSKENPDLAKCSRSITDFRLENGFDDSYKSHADSWAGKYRKRGRNIRRSQRGLKLNLISINFDMIKEIWEKI